MPVIEPIEPVFHAPPTVHPADAAALDAIITRGVRSAVMDQIAPLFTELHRFADRRIAELSAEVHAAVQLLDFSETSLAHQIGSVQEQIEQLIAAPKLSTRNSGMELEAVVIATEAAANRILDAAETIAAFIDAGKQDQAALRSHLDSIFEACSFQDLSGQRLRRAIAQLQNVDSALSKIVASPAVEAPPATAAAAEVEGDLSQAAIDAMMAAD